MGITSVGLTVPRMVEPGKWFDGSVRVVLSNGDTVAAVTVQGTPLPVEVRNLHEEQEAGGGGGSGISVWVFQARLSGGTPDAGVEMLFCDVTSTQGDTKSDHATVVVVQ